MHGEGTGRLNEHSPGPEEPKRVDGAGLRRIALSAACECGSVVRGRAIYGWHLDGLCAVKKFPTAQLGGRMRGMV
jgi:hypothetical protein